MSMFSRPIGHSIAGMRAVLGIDAAWTLTQPSGVALAVEDADGWQLVAAEASYHHFHARTDGLQQLEVRPSGALPDVPALLSAATGLCEGRVDLVAVDMPLALSPIIGRRTSDNAVSRAYGGRKCGTHTPSAQRPGMISDQLREAFDRAGYGLQTTSISPPGVIEVYPHPALVELAGASERLPYKAAKIRNYWRSDSPAARRGKLLRQWEGIVELLNGEIAGVSDALPKPTLEVVGWRLKAYEDALDAVICAWVAICALEGRAVPFGDEDSAIWIPVRTSALETKEEQPGQVAHR